MSTALIMMKYLRPSLVLLIVAVLAYGLLIPRLGFYWDDLPITWIRYQMGPEALTRYFSTNRPVWGLLHQLTTSVIPQVPADWQVFALLWRWAGAVAVYAIMVRLLEDKPGLSLGVALLFLVYPGFNQHWAAYLYSHFYIVFFFFLFSLFCMLRALESPKQYWAWTVAGMLFSALNLWMMEYFYVLELVRVGVILTALRHEPLGLRERGMRTLKLWLPYLAVFILAVLSRLFIFNNQIYGMSLTDQFKSAPAETLQALVQSILLSLRLVLKNAWLRMLELPDTSLNIYYGVVAAVIGVAAGGFLLSPRDDAQTVRKNSMDALWLIGLGALAVFLAGWPFWLVGFTPSLEWPASRFTLPFTLGVSLIFGGLVGLIPWERGRIVLLVSLVSLAAGKQYLTSQDFVKDWETQKALFWQLSWRAPGLQPNSLVLLNEGPLNFYADNSLGAALNWIYAPDNHSDRVEYILFYPKTRLKNVLPELKTGLPIEYDYLAGQFHGNTSQALALYYAPPGCLRVLDPEVEGANRSIQETSLMRFAAHISNLNLIVQEPRARMPVIYGREPEHDFCYYFQQADLARQFKDWATVMKMSEMALAFENHPFEPSEQFVFIEGYAHAEQWERAVELTRKSHEALPEKVDRALCQLWKRIRTETTDSLERGAALDKIQSMFACDL